jgi:hypothetical protein
MALNYLQRLVGYNITIDGKYMGLRRIGYLHISRVFVDGYHIFVRVHSWNMRNTSGLYNYDIRTAVAKEYLHNLFKLQYLSKRHTLTIYYHDYSIVINQTEVK